ncbi:hypothetical protein [Marinivivus vitaminiproducens]|uniref:hypothetical protein n=1 Tax=Marinivivus vitaminiproducens TaxID=3035935 RepID=UPI0027990AF9|nr:hypothetical protein P4R82_21740 [Geminicoccaceae bacterium SCSIO 64248]
MKVDLRLLGVGICLVVVTAPVPAKANKPLIGVSCGGGFYVRAPTKKVYWVHGEPPVRTEAFDGSDALVALAQCDKGVVSVIGDAEKTGHSKVFYSPDCLDIGAAANGTDLIYDGSEAVRGLDIGKDGLTISFVSGRTQTAAICTKD